MRLRGRLEARILRAPFYEMIEWGEERAGVLGIQSLGAFFELRTAWDGPLIHACCCWRALW